MRGEVPRWQLKCLPLACMGLLLEFGGYGYEERRKKERQNRKKRRRHTKGKTSSKEMTKEMATSMGIENVEDRNV